MNSPLRFATELPIILYVLTLYYTCDIGLRYMQVPIKFVSLIKFQIIYWLMILLTVITP